MTSLTQRSSGLVQRRTEASRNAADKERAAGGGGGNGEDDAQSRRDEQDDDDKGDSKETRLTLMEEVLLLGLKDREVRPRRAGRGRPARGSGARREPGHWFRASALGAPELRARERPAGPVLPDPPRTDCLDFPFSFHSHSLNFDSPTVSFFLAFFPSVSNPYRPQGTIPTWRLRVRVKHMEPPAPRTHGSAGFRTWEGSTNLPSGGFKKQTKNKPNSLRCTFWNFGKLR